MPRKLGSCVRELGRLDELDGYRRQVLKIMLADRGPHDQEVAGTQ